MIASFSSIRFRVIILVLFAVIPAFAVLLFTEARYRRLTAREVQRNALSAARIIAAEQERVLENAHQLLITLARVPQIRERAGGACSKILSGLLEALYADLGVFDLKGNVLCRALVSKSFLAKPSASYIDRVTETRDFSVGELRTFPSNGKTFVDVAYPVVDSPGVLRAIVFGVLDLSWLTRITAQTHLYPGAAFNLIDGEGTVLLRYPDAGEWVGQRILATAPGNPTSFTGHEGTLEAIGADGVTRLFAFSRLKRRIGDQNVYALIDIPTAVAFADLTRILVFDLALLGILSALTLAAAWFGSELVIFRRINDLVNATNQLAVGKLSTRTKLAYGKSELGQMARSFDELAKTLEEREAEAKRSAAEIEKQRQRQNALYGLNLAITSTLDLNSILSALLDKIAALFPTCVASVSWINNETGTLELIAHRMAAGEKETDHAALRGDEEGLARIVFDTQSPLSVLDAHMDPQTTNPEFFRKHGLFSYFGLPLIAQGKALGVLSFYRKEKNEFTNEETDFLSTLANQAAIAIYNSWTYEQVRNQAIELDKSNRIKDEFLGVMSHELRTPLNVIMNYAEGLRMGIFGEISSEQEKGAHKIHHQAKHLLALINEILEITKIETGAVTLQREPVDLDDFITEMRSDYLISRDHDVALNWQYSVPLPSIVSDPTKMKQILTNLINNALKFTEQGSVTVAVAIANQGKTLEIRVSDTGPGIPDQLLPVIFEKFRQIDSTTTRTHSGAGLGLYIVKTFVELLDGTITVQSKLGHGSVFTVRLPIQCSEKDAPTR